MPFSAASRNAPDCPQNAQLRKTLKDVFSLDRMRAVPGARAVVCGSSRATLTRHPPPSRVLPTKPEKRRSELCRNWPRVPPDPLSPDRTESASDPSSSASAWWDLIAVIGLGPPTGRTKPPRVLLRSSRHNDLDPNSLRRSREVHHVVAYRPAPSALTVRATRDRG